MKSMTGYGAGSAQAPAARVAVEMRGVNQRFLDVRVTAAREYAAWEREIRNRVQVVAQRGRVDVTVVRTPVAARRRYAVTVRMELARAYVRAGRDVSRRLGLGGSLALADVLRLPDLFEVSERAPELAPELPAIRRALTAALRAFDGERRREGDHLRRDMQRRVARLRQATTTIRRRLPRALAALRARVEERLPPGHPATGPDPIRGAGEAALLAERRDIPQGPGRLASPPAAPPAPPPA